MRGIKLICLLSLFAVLAHFEPIPALAQLDGLELDSVALTNVNQSESQVYIHNFANQFQATPQLALAIVGIEETNLTLDTSFHVMPQSVTQTGITLSWSRNLQKWVRITVKYLASTRSDIMLGCKQALIVQSGNSTTTLNITTDPILNSNTSILRTFLLGCDSDTASVECGLLPKAVGSSSIAVDIYGLKMSNASISFSYLVFSPSTAGFTSYGGYLTNQSFRGGFSSDLHKSIAYTPYRFHGLSYLNFSTATSTNILSSIDDDLILQFASENLINRYALFYVILGKTAKNTCGKSTSTPFQHLTQCLEDCPSGTYVFNYTDGGKGCKSCSKILNLQLINGTCVASNQTKKQANLTSLLELFHQTANKVIVSDNNANTQTTGVQTAASASTSSYQPVPITSSQAAVQSQPTPAQTDHSQITASPQAQQTQVQQAQVASNSQASHQAYEVVTDASCSPSAPTSNASSSPTSSPYEAQPSAGYSSNALGLATQTSPTQTTSANTYSPSNAANPSCSPRQFAINGVCVCQVGFTYFNGDCLPIESSAAELQPIILDSSGSSAPSTTSTVVPVAPQMYNTAPKIDCGQGYDNGFGVCVCSSGLQFSQGRCIYVASSTGNQSPTVVNNPTCGANMYFDVNCHKCLCVKNFVFDSNGQCRSCGLNAEARDGKCQCLPNFIFEDGLCVLSSANTPVIQSNCSDVNNKTASGQNNVLGQPSSNNTNDKPHQTCGNGIIEGNQQCDDQNVQDNDGCSSKCQIERGYTCEKAPSICILKSRPNTDSNSTSKNQNDTQKYVINATSPNLQLYGEVKANNNQIFLTLDAINPFNFADQQSMRSFLKAKFTGCPPPTVFCSQEASKKNLFDCLLLFPSGIPNKSFIVNFSYSYQSKTGSCSVPVDPLKIQVNQSNARTNAKTTQNSRVA